MSQVRRARLAPVTDAGRLVVIAVGPGAPSPRAAEAGADGVVPVEDVDPADVAARVAGGATVVVGATGPTSATAEVVGAVLDADLLVEVVPAADRAVAALVASGLPTDRFAVDPPLPAAGPARDERLARLAAATRTTVLPLPADRGAADLAAVAATCGPDHPLALAAPDGTVWRGPAGSAPRSPAEPEAVLVVGAAPVVDGPGEQAGDEVVLAALREARARGLAPGRAAAEVAAATGRPRREVYALGAALPTRAEDVDP